MLAGCIARAHGKKGFKGVIKSTFRGNAGQSFKECVLPGFNVRLIGESNDYVGKGMHGRDVVVVPDEKLALLQVNLALLGRAGERFCVRNSGVKAVVEGTGDHACEHDQWRRSGS